MLNTLRIENLAIVESLEVDLGPGLTVVTGETGAGKSIVVRALKLVLGGRATPDLVRSGARAATVEALFRIGDGPMRQRLSELDLPVEEELLIRRTLLPGRSRASINGRLATAAQLRALSKGLVDISSQHEHHTLADPASHLPTLDAWTGRPALVRQVARSVRAAAEAQSALEGLRLRVAEREDQEEWLQFQLSELVRIDPRAGELAVLEASVRRAQHAERLRSVTAEAEHVLYGREAAVCGELIQLESTLARAVEQDPSLAALVDQLAGARADLEDAAQHLGRYARGIDTEPGELARQQERLGELERLARRFAGDLDAAVARRATLEAELAELEQVDDHVLRLEAQAAAKLAKAGEAAQALSQARREAADALGAAISRELADLGMGGAEVHVAVAPMTPGSSDLVHEGARLTPRGIDQVEFLIAPNPGEPPRPLARIASGGELSRALLATKRVLGSVGPVGTYVFDEVDTGVGGAVAEAIGRKLQQVGRHHQVLCVTHAPQIAALGRAHLRSEKQVSNGRTHSHLVALPPEDRVEEVARMLGGRTVTDAARHAARALLQAA